MCLRILFFLFFGLLTFSAFGQKPTAILLDSTYGYRQYTYLWQDASGNVTAQLDTSDDGDSPSGVNTRFFYSAGTAQLNRASVYETMTDRATDTVIRQGNTVRFYRGPKRDTLSQVAVFSPSGELLSLTHYGIVYVFDEQYNIINTHWGAKDSSVCDWRGGQMVKTTYYTSTGSVGTNGAVHRSRTLEYLAFDNKPNWKRVLYKGTPTAWVAPMNNPLKIHVTLFNHRTGAITEQRDASCQYIYDAKGRLVQIKATQEYVQGPIRISYP